MSDEHTAAARFQSCRWATTEYCNHADVRAYSGRKGFDPQAWCPGCALFKPKRQSRRVAPAKIRCVSPKAGITLDLRGSSSALDCLPPRVREAYRLRLLAIRGDTAVGGPLEEAGPTADPTCPEPR